MKIKKTTIICCTILFFQLLWMQTKVFCPEIGATLYQIIYYMKYFGSMILVVYTLSYGIRKTDYCKQKKYIKIFIPLFILYFLVELICLFNGYPATIFGLSYWTRSLAILLDKVFVLVEICCISILCREKALQYITDTIIVDGIVIIVIAAFRMGIMRMLSVFGEVFSFSSDTSLMEVHELTYCAGLLLAYFLFFKRDKSKSDILRTFLLFIVFWSGNKRIAYLALAVAGCFAFMVRKKGINKRNLIVIGIIGVLISITFVGLVYNEAVFVFLISRGINLMGRNTIVSYFTRLSRFSVDFIGWGNAGVAKMFETRTRAMVGNDINVAGLHNDILKIYLNNGFVGSIIWYFLNLVYVPCKIYNQIGKKEASLFMISILFAFVTYLTDNTEGYFVFQVLLLGMPVFVNNKDNYLKGKYEENKRINSSFDIPE